MATLIVKMATLSRQMANDLEKMATVQQNLATVPTQMDTPAQFIAVIDIKAAIKWIGREGNNDYSINKDEHIVEIG